MKKAFTMIEGLIVAAIIGILLAFALSNFSKARARSSYLSGNWWVSTINSASVSLDGGVLEGPVGGAFGTVSLHVTNITSDTLVFRIFNKAEQWPPLCEGIISPTRIGDYAIAITENMITDRGSQDSEGRKTLLVGKVEILPANRERERSYLRIVDKSKPPRPKGDTW